MGQAARRWHHRRCVNRWSAPMPQPNDLSRSLVALDQDSTIIAVVEMSQSSWLVAGMLPGIERQPRKKLEPSPERLLGLLHRWRDEAVKAGRKITRIALAFEAGRDGFWLARWLEAHGVEAHVIHPSSVAVSREHRRAKTDRLDTELLKRGFLGWLRGERGHCTMARVPTIAEEDAKRPNRERECLVGERTRIVNRMKGTLARLGIRNFKPTLRKAADGKTEFWDHGLESFTLMAGLAAITSRIRLYASVAVLTIPPAIVARMASTIADISGGRFGVNIVSGSAQRADRHGQ